MKTSPTRSISFKLIASLISLTVLFTAHSLHAQGKQLPPQEQQSQALQFPVTDTLTATPTTQDPARQVSVKQVPAQQISNPQASVPSAPAATPAVSEELDEEDFIKSSRPSVADPAEFHKPGVLQVEYGADANFRAEEFESELVAPLTLRFAASRRVLLQLDFDSVISQKSDGEQRVTGVGDVRLGTQINVLRDTEAHPALAFGYSIKLPTADDSKQLGSNRFDHRAVALVSKKVGKNDLDFNLAYLLIGREDSERRTSGGQAAFSVTRELNDRFDFIAEVSGQSETYERERGIYPLAAIAYKPNRRVQIDFGARCGIGAEAPRAGLFANLTVGVADFFRRD